jgi:hypothetical protein
MRDYSDFPRDGSEKFGGTVTRPGVLDAMLPGCPEDFARLAQLIVTKFEDEPTIAALVIRWWPDRENITVVFRGGRA